MLRSVIRRFAPAAALAAAAVSGQTLDEAVSGLAKRVSARLSVNEPRQIAHQSLCSLPAAEMQRARAAFEKPLRRRTAASAPAARITLTFSENRAGYLLVAEIRRGEERIVETAPFKRSPANVRPKLSVVKQLVWEQEAPVLDLLHADNRMYVFSPGSLAMYETRDGRWQMLKTAPLPSPPVRDPRGKLALGGGELSVFAPGLTCRVTADDAFDVRCDGAPAAFDLAGIAARWTPARNTLEAEGWPAFFHIAKLGGAVLIAAADGRVYLHGEDGRQFGPLDGWNAGDFSALESPCAPAQLLASRDAASLQMFELNERRLAETSEPEPLPGVLTALWPSAGGAVAVVRDRTNSQYAAYHVTVACRP
jgi:hypothetical protein